MRFDANDLVSTGLTVVEGNRWFRRCRRRAEWREIMLLHAPSIKRIGQPQVSSSDASCLTCVEDMRLLRKLKLHRPKQALNVAYLCT